MYEFRCGSPACRSKFSAPTKDELMEQVVQHVKTEHRIPVPTKSIVSFLEANTITEVVSPEKAR